MIQTSNLQLIPFELTHLEAALRDKQELGPILGVSVPRSWPVFAEVIPYVRKHLKADPSLLGWWTYLFIHAPDRTLIGMGGFKGKADSSGMVEIGYEIIPEYRNRGLATEAAEGFVRYAFSQPHISRVEAHTLAEINTSTRVLERVGMKRVGAEHDPDHGEVWLWRNQKPWHTPA